MATGLPLKLWTVDEYEEMIERGILDEDDRVELIRGEIVEMTPIGIRHASCVTNLEALFYKLPESVVTVLGQNPIRLLDNSEPQPDVALLKGHRSSYSRRRPTADDVLMVVEVSDTTLRIDRSVKLPIYAEARIPVAWIVNLEEDVIEVYSEPASREYQEKQVARRGSSIPLPGGLPGVVSVDEVLG